MKPPSAVVRKSAFTVFTKGSKRKNSASGLSKAGPNAFKKLGNFWLCFLAKGALSSIKVLSD